MRLAGKVAMITGAGSGMGEATALLFAREGAKVAVLDVNQAAADRVVAEIREKGGQAIAVIGDISSSAEVARMVARTADELGPPTVLHNNCGIQTEDMLPMIEVDEGAFDRIIAVNLKAPWLMMKAVAPHMIEAGGGSIINTASIGAYLVLGAIGYCASKAGLLAMTRVAAAELGRHNIRVNSLCPGVTLTPMTTQTAGNVVGRRVIGPTKISALGNRPARAEEMAYMALFLASDESSYATGADFVNDGGMSVLAGLELNPDPKDLSVAWTPD